MKITATLLATSLFAPILLILGSSAAAAAAASLVIGAGLAAIALSDYGQSAEPNYAKAHLASARHSTAERHPLAA